MTQIPPAAGQPVPPEGGTQVVVGDSQAVSDLAQKVGQLQEGMATRQDIDTLRVELEGIKQSSTAYITRAQYDALVTRLDAMATEAQTASAAPAQITAPAPPAPTPEELAAQQQQAQAAKGPARFGVSLFNRSRE